MAPLTRPWLTDPFWRDRPDQRGRWREDGALRAASPRRLAVRLRGTGPTASVAQLWSRSAGRDSERSDPEDGVRRLSGSGTATDPYVLVIVQEVGNRSLVSTFTQTVKGDQGRPGSPEGTWTFTRTEQTSTAASIPSGLVPLFGERRAGDTLSAAGSMVGAYLDGRGAGADGHDTLIGSPKADVFVIDA